MRLEGHCQGAEGPRPQRGHSNATLGIGRGLEVTVTRRVTSLTSAAPSLQLPGADRERSWSILASISDPSPCCRTHAALGVQAADLVFRLADEGWNAEATPVQQPVSVQSVVDLPWTRRHFQFREEAIDRIDRIVE